MRLFLKIAGLTTLCFLGVAIIAVFVMMTGAFDITQRSYSTAADALKDKAFERGWLPAFTPRSAVHISLSHNSDVCTTNGEFHFAPADSQELVDAIQSSDDGDRRHGVALLREKQLLQEGYRRYDYNSGSTCCTFLIHAEQGRCEFAAGGFFKQK
jgi:hypothetical protein